MLTYKTVPHIKLFSSSSGVRLICRISLRLICRFLNPPCIVVYRQEWQGFASSCLNNAHLFPGERTRRHFFGEPIEAFLNVDMYRRPATTYTGRVVMDYGRAGDGYYTQRFPSMSRWQLLKSVPSSPFLQNNNSLHGNV